jgi:hypothetical protein
MHTLRPQLCDPPAGAEGRHPPDPGAARSQEARDHDDLHARRHRDPARGGQPAGETAARVGPPRGALRPGGRRHLPHPWARLAQGPARSPEPGPAQGHVGHRAVPQRGAGWACLALARDVVPTGSPTTRAVTAIARSARPAPHDAGFRRARPICCRWSTTTWSSRCRRRSPTSRTRTRPWSTGCCSTWPPRRCCTIAADPEAPGCKHRRHLVLHTWGSALTHHPHVHGIVPAAGWRRTASAGWRASPASSSPCACCRGCSGGASSKSSSRCIARRLQFFGEHAALGRRQRLRPLARTASPVRVGRLCQAPVRRTRGGAGAICRATRTGSRSPTAARRHGRARRDLRLEGLPGQGQDASQDDDARCSRVTCGAFCCTSCPGGFPSAFATTDCSPNGSPQGQPGAERASCSTQCPAGPFAHPDSGAEIDHAKALLRLPALAAAAMLFLQTFVRGEDGSAAPPREPCAL